MNTLPYELIFSIAVHLDSPKDLCSFSEVSTVFYNVSRDERLWKRFCSQLYKLSPEPETMKQSYYELFSKILVPYGRYLGYWKSNQQYVSGIIEVKLNLTDETIQATKIKVSNAALSLNQFFLLHAFDDVVEDNDNDEDASLRPIYNRTSLFTINTISKEIHCHECDAGSSTEFSWGKTFDNDRPYFGLSEEALPLEERYSLISRDAIDPNERDVYFIKRCSNDESLNSIIYRPLAIPKPMIDGHSHILTRFNGMWVGSYGGHGLELLQLRYFAQFECPVTADGPETEVQLLSDVLVARKITGDPNVPHGQISFAAVRPFENESNIGKCYEGVGQIAQTGYYQPEFIRTKVRLLSENSLKVTWYALHHTSLFKRCTF